MEADISRLKEITVLYCEDEEYLRDITKGILESFTKKQFICKDGAEGLEIFKDNQHLIDLVITDVNMPNMNGLEMAKEIKKINPSMPVVVATAFSNSEYLLEAIDLGIDKYVLKPINVKKLLDIMSKSLLYHELRGLYIDQLTKLQNRNALIKDTKKIDKSILALINVDKFSVLNDLYGEDYGDEILLSLVFSIKKTFQNNLYNIYRVGSDNFVVLSKNMDIDIKEFKLICTDFIKKTNSNGIQIGEENIDISITIAIAQSTDNHAFEYAQRVIPEARKKYQNLLEYDKEQFDQKKDIQENIAWIKRLKSGLTDGRFQPYFQPIIDADTQEIYKYEALIRYIDEEGNEIAPDKFLGIAKKARIYPIIIKVMLSSVLNIIREKQIRVAVNLSFDDIIHSDTHQFIFNTLEKYKDEAKLLDFEILESEEIEDFAIVKTFIDKIRSYGCQIGVDDFGAGYSNFNMLEALNVDFVKIDGSLIKNIDTLPKHALIVETISDFCTKLGIKTVAEFVSTEEIYQKTKDLGIKYMQGWHFGKAVSQDCI